MRMTEQEFDIWLKRPGQHQGKIPRKNKHPEFDLQCQVANYLHLQYPGLLWTVGLGGVRVTPGVAKKIKASGYRPGTPDIMIFQVNCIRKKYGLHLELKSEKGKISEEQHEWAIKVMNQGEVYEIAYSFDEAKKIIDDYLG